MSESGVCAKTETATEIPPASVSGLPEASQPPREKWTGDAFPVSPASVRFRIEDWP
jgi:hypothetical protein